MKQISQNPTKRLGLFIILLLSIPYLYLTWKNTKEDRDYTALQITKTIAATLSVKDLQKLEGKPQDINKSEYKELKNKLQAIIRADKKVRFAYTYAKRNDIIYTIADSEPINSKYYSPPGINCSKSDSIYKQVFINEKPIISKTHSPFFGDWISVLVPIKNPTTQKTAVVFAMDFNVNSWNYPIFFNLAQSLLVILLTTFLFLFFIRIKSKNIQLKKELEKRTQADRELKRSETRLNEVLKNSQDIFYKAKLDGTILKLSESIENFADYKAADLIGTDVTELYYNKKDREILLEILEKKGKVKDYEIKMQLKDGVIKYFLINATIVFDNNDQPLYIEGAMKDITERKNTRQKLIDSENFLRTIINNQPECIKIVDKKGLLLMMNPAGLEMIEADSFEQVNGKNVVNLIDANDKTNFLKLHKKVISGKSDKLIFEINGLKGGSRWVETFAAPMTLNSKTVHIAHTRDITERKATEDLLKESEQFLKESQKIGHIGSYDFNICKGTWKSSEVLDDIFGIDKNFEKTVDTWKSIIHPEWTEIMDHYLLNEVIGEKKDFNKEYKIIRKNDGAVRWVHGMGRLHFDTTGKPGQLIGVIQDITRQKEFEEQLNQAKNKAEESERLKSAFLANMSHEIRTPMNGILGFTELLKEPDLSGEKQQEYINIIRKSGKRMLNIINDIIDISKIESGLMQMHFVETNINEQLEYIYSFFQHEAANKSIELSYHTELQHEKAFINSDRGKILNILTNLVKNAIKFTPTGRIEFGYRTKLIANKNGDVKVLEFYVKDTGNGIERSQLDIIFERFRQTSESTAKNYEGAGLGLAITKSFVEMLDGEIWVESELGKGSTFYFTLPYNHREKEKIKETVTLPVAEPDVYQNLKILIAEDDEISAKLLGISVKAISKSVIRARNGEEVVELAKNNPDIDLILMDIQMPKLDGYQATGEIRKFNSEVIIIAQSAFAFSEDIDKAINAGCNGHISKPVKKVELLQIVDKHFKNKKRAETEV